MNWAGQALSVEVAVGAVAESGGGAAGVAAAPGVRGTRPGGCTAQRVRTGAGAGHLDQARSLEPGHRAEDGLDVAVGLPAGEGLRGHAAVLLHATPARVVASQGAGVAVASEQYGATSDRPVSRQDLRPGDLLFWSHGGSGSIYHIAIYAGDGNVLHAPRTGRVVELQPLTSAMPQGDYFGATRP